jgi:type IV pilus assembly protein PilB
MNRFGVYSDQEVISFLQKGNYISEADATKALEQEKADAGRGISALLDQDIVTTDLIGQAIAEQLGCVYSDLNSRKPTRDTMLLIPEASAVKNRLVAYQVKDNLLLIATDDVQNAKKQEKEIEQAVAGKAVQFAYALPEDITEALTVFRKALETRFTAIIEKTKRVAPEIIEEIINDALIYHSSDIHFEPQHDEVVIRFRIDGILEEAGRIPLQYYSTIVNRVKVQARLRIDEHYAAQDGAIRYEHAGQVTDMRVSIVPTVNGEKIVLRLLSEYARNFTLEDVGLGDHHEAQLREAFAKPFGMILVTGPTGSGKTTTLYTVVKALNTPNINITTIEDPVEYKISGINQIQVNVETELTFAKGLRSIVRQDPDVILVGEIRDTDTAEIAVNAALTGHLLLSTFHANDAATAIPRLIDMGIEPFLLASTLETILAQRLVRRICDHCRVSAQYTAADIKKQYPDFYSYFRGSKVTLYKGKGCDVCHNTGYRGRIAIVEFISVTPEMEALILERPSTQEIWKLAHEQGSGSLFEDGIAKAQAGLTTPEEVLRVASPTEQRS